MNTNLKINIMCDLKNVTVEQNANVIVVTVNNL